MRYTVCNQNKKDGNRMERTKFSKDLGMIFTLLLPVIYVVLGVLLLFVDGISTKVFANLFGAAAIVFGAALIILYFMRRSYLDMHAYGFSIGAFAVVLGICIIIKSEDIANSLSVLLNLCIMLTAIIKAQNAIQLKFVGSILWIPVLCISGAFLVCTVLIAINPFKELSTRDTFTYIVLICDGIASFANSIMLRVLLHKKNKESATEIEPV